MTTENYLLREIENGDISNIYLGLSDPEVTKFYDVHFDSLEATKEQMKWYADLKKNGTGMWWGIYNRKEDVFCGATGFNNLDINNQKAEIGFWLLKKYWGLGILKEVMPLLLKVGFNEMQLNRIEGFVVSNNVASKKVLNKSKFKHEGTMRECELKNGERISLDIYSLLRSEWIKS